MILIKSNGYCASGTKRIDSNGTDEAIDHEKTFRVSQTTDNRRILAPLSDEKRVALEKLRKTIKAAAPKAEECISYGIPGFRLNGRLLVSFGAAAKHCSFYPGAHPIKAHEKELKTYATSKGTIRFSPDRGLPISLVRKLVKTRIAEYSGK